MQEIIDTNKSELLSEAQKMKSGGYRLVQICATKYVEEFILLYSFAKNDDEFINYRVALALDEPIESISWLYSYAFIYENEIKDLFGVKIEDITLDFKGNFYKTSIKTPFKQRSQNEWVNRR